MEDYYHILGLSQTAMPDEIKKAYRKLSLKFHPDQNGGDEYFMQMFRQVNIAYNTLIDPAKKQVYDHELKAHRANRSHAERIRKLEEELAIKEQQLRANRPQTQQPGYANGNISKRNFRRTKRNGASLKIWHVKYFLWLVIVGLVLGLAAKKSEPQSVSVKKKISYVNKRKHKPRKKKKRSFQAEAIDTTAIIKNVTIPMDTIAALDVRDSL